MLNKAQHLYVSAEHAGRRIDNYLTSQLKGVPKSRLYQMLRKGEVRVNSARIKQDHRVQAGDDVRIPPYFVDKDSDRDGMPDDWERSRGLNPSSGSDANRDRDGDGYTNIEEYLDSVVRRVSPAQSSRRPVRQS